MSSPSLIVSNYIPFVDGNVTASSNLTWAGTSCTAFYGLVFTAYESQTINRAQFRVATITSGANFTLKAGICTFDRTTGLPWTESGAGITLQFNTSSTLTNVTSNSDLIFSFSDFTTVKNTKYFVGMQVTNITGSFSALVQWLGFNGSIAYNSNNPVIYRTSTNVLGDTNQSVVNWGYDSGNAVTSWYNKTPGSYNFSALGNSLTNHQGTTLFFNTDVNSFYVDSITVFMRNPSTFPTGTATTMMAILYDSDGVTPLIGCTFGGFGKNINNPGKTYFPIKYWFQNQKLYHLSFISHGATPVNNTIVTTTMPYLWQSGFALTTQRYTKTSGSATPSYVTNGIIPFYLRIDAMRGNRQGGPGNESIF